MGQSRALYLPGPSRSGPASVRQEICVGNDFDEPLPDFCAV